MPRAHTLFGLVTEAARRFPDRPAVHFPRSASAPARTLSYAALLEEVQRAAGLLAELGFGPGDPVGLWMEKTPDAVVALLAILARGGCYVPLDPQAPAPRVARIAANVGLRAIVTSGDKAQQRVGELLTSEPLPALRHVVARTPGPFEPGEVTLSTWGDRPGGAEAFHPTVTGGYLAYLLHTSGSTGTPKGVAISHDDSLAFVECAADFWEARETDVFACHAPLHFDLTVFDLFVAFRAGASVVLLPEFYSAFPKKMAEAIDDHGVTIWNSVVSALTLLVDKVDLGKRSLRTVRHVIFSGELMPMRVLRKVRGSFTEARLWNVYGQTEANTSMFHEVVGDVPEDDGARLPIGKPLPGFEVFALREDGSLVDRPGDLGELCVRGGTVASGGYYRDEARSAEKFVLDPILPDTRRRIYRTGDLARLEADGSWSFAGRTDNLIKTRGYRVELGEVELAVQSAPGVGEAAVIAIPDESIGHRLVAFAVPTEGATLDPKEVLAHVGRRLPAYMVPSELHARASFPRTSTQKIDRRALSADLEAAT